MIVFRTCGCGSTISYKSVDGQVVSCEAVVLVLVGLPARGKSFICGAVVRHGRSEAPGLLGWYNDSSKPKPIIGDGL